MPSGSFQLYNFDISQPAAGAACGVFAALTLVHLWRLWKTRAWSCIPFAVGGVCTSLRPLKQRPRANRAPVEVIGYIGRISSASQPHALGPYIVQSLMILLAPALFAASIYMALGRLVRAMGAQHLSVVPAARMTNIFVSGDVLSFLTQLAGGGVQATQQGSSYRVGANIIVAGLFIQVVFFGFFVASSAVFHVRVNRYGHAHADSALRWRRQMRMLYGVSALILVRSVYRVVEYIQGYDGYLLGREWPLYVFDAALMASAMVLFAVFHPGSFRAEHSPKAGSVVELRGRDAALDQEQRV